MAGGSLLVDLSGTIFLCKSIGFGFGAGGATTTVGSGAGGAGGAVAGRQILEGQWIGALSGKQVKSSSISSPKNALHPNAG